MPFIRKTKSLLAGLALTALASGAQAVVLNVTDYMDSSGNLYTGTYVVDTPAGESSGKISLWSVQSPSPADSFLAYCIELSVAISSGADYLREGNFSVVAEVQELYDRFYGDVTRSEDIGLGFQLALWQLLGQANALFAPSGAVTEANRMVDAVNNGTDPYAANVYDFVRWNANGSQDLLQAVAASNEVPEPATQALLLSGLALVALSLRRRRQAQSERE